MKTTNSQSKHRTIWFCTFFFHRRTQERNTKYKKFFLRFLVRFCQYFAHWTRTSVCWKLEVNKKNLQITCTLSLSMIVFLRFPTFGDLKSFWKFDDCCSEVFKIWNLSLWVYKRMMLVFFWLKQTKFNFKRFYYSNVCISKVLNIQS